ncbi:hypothetical protein LTR01_006141 [Friedmanniomyces endolithicus]|nr:hypothetical protein LTR01_006141 [Friedmanniomyces endolithicus]KAK0834028.1 hypothetical protein LTR73_001791 [Friedmanniomyces endolithicus]
MAGSYDQEIAGDTNPSINGQVSASSKSGVGHDRTIDGASSSAMDYRDTHTNMASFSYEDGSAPSTRMYPSAHQCHITASDSSYFGAARSGGDPLYHQTGFNHASETLETSPYKIPQYNASPYYHPQFSSHVPHAVSTQPQAHHAHRPPPMYPANTTSTNQVPLISSLNVDVTTPTKASRPVKIVHTVEPANDQVLSRYKIGYYTYGERSKLDAPISKCKLPRAHGKTEDVWRCGKKSCRSCDMTENGYTDLTAAVAKKYGFLNTTTKKSYSDKGSLTVSSAQPAAVPTLVAKSERERTAGVQVGGIVAQEGTKSDLDNFFAQPQHKRKAYEAHFEDRDAKRRRLEFTEDLGEPENVETDSFELQIEDEISAGFQGMEAGLGLAREYSCSAQWPTNPSPFTEYEDATERSDAISVVGLKCAGFNGMLTDISEGAWGYDALGAMGGSAKMGAESDMELPDGVSYSRGHTCL